MYNQIVNFISKSTELLELTWFQILCLIILCVFYFVIKKSQIKIHFFSQFKNDSNLITYITIMVLLIFISLNIVHTSYPLWYSIYFLLTIPFVVLSKCNRSTKAFMLLTFNIYYFINTYLTPLVCIQQNESWLYLGVILSIFMLLMCLSMTHAFFVIIFTGVVSFLNITCFSLYQIFQVLYMNDAFMFNLLVTIIGISWYIILLLVYYVVSKRFSVGFKYCCNTLNNASRIRLLLIGFAVILLSLCFRNIYLYNLFVLYVLDYFEIVVLLDGSKNPHHQWECGRWVTETLMVNGLYGQQVRQITTCSFFIYKQQHHTELNQLLDRAKKVRYEINKYKIQEDVISKNEKKKLDVLIHDITKDPGRHYAVVQTIDGKEYVSFVTHSEEVDGEKTLRLLETKIQEKKDSFMTKTSVLVDTKYKSEVLSKKETMQDATMRELNNHIAKNSEKFNQEQQNQIRIDESITMAEKNSAILENVKRYDTGIIEREKRLKEIKEFKQNDANNEVD